MVKNDLLAIYNSLLEAQNSLSRCYELLLKEGLTPVVNKESTHYEDVLKKFFRDKKESIKSLINKHGRIPRKDLWALFETERHIIGFTKIHFYKTCRSLGYEVKKYNGNFVYYAKDIIC